MHHSRAKLFADGSNLFIISNNLSQLYDKANSDLSQLAQWVSLNKLHINYDKTTHMIFSPNKKVLMNESTTSDLKLYLNGNIIDRVTVVKYLGVLIDDKLDWTNHINSIINKLSSITGILARTSVHLPLKYKKIFIMY